MKVLYLAATGAADATRASIPLHLAANGSVDAGQECAVVLVGDGAELAVRETAQRMEDQSIGIVKVGEARLVTDRLTARL